jgi:hypothetical protein
VAGGNFITKSVVNFTPRQILLDDYGKEDDKGGEEECIQSFFSKT